QLAGSSRLHAVDGLLARERAEGIEREAHGGMVHRTNDVPRLAVILDVTAPGQRLESDAQATRSRSIAQLTEVINDAAAIGERFRRDVRADEHEVGAEFLHDVEL